MTKDQFDRQQWRKGMKIKNTVTGAVFEVGGVDFGGRICLLIHGTPCWLPYMDYETVEDAIMNRQQNKGVVLFGYPYLYQNGDLGFHEKMAELGLSRGGAILGGLPNKCVLANKHEYFLVDYYMEEDFCGQYELKATYAIDDFIQEVSQLKSEERK